MTTEDFASLEQLLDRKLSTIRLQTEENRDDIKAFKAIFGAAVWLGGAILAIVVAFQGWSHK